MKMYYKDIFEAINCNDIEAVKTFLPDQLEAKNCYGKTPLMSACELCCTEIVKLLLDSGADVNATSQYGNVSLHYICLINDSEETASLLQEIIGLLLGNGADIEAKNKDGCTPLHTACDFGHNFYSELLVKNGADIFVTDNNGKTALDLDIHFALDESGNKVPHKEILFRLRTEYINKQTLEVSEHTAALSSGWEMEI